MLLLSSGSEAATRGSEGVSREGMQELLDQINVVMIDNAQTNLMNYTAFEDTLRQYWQGTDCDQWIANFEKLAQEISDSLESYYNQIDTEFNKVFTSWENFQAGHVSQG